MKIARTYGTMALAALSLAGTAGAAEILVSSDIATSTTWTSNNRYNLQGQIYVRPGATLTIQKGTVVASAAGGSLAVTRDARLICQGTAAQPVIFTSKNDFNTWTAGNPNTGTWRATANEWGNLTICGNAYIGKYGQGAPSTNTAAPAAGNYANMEGLTASSSTDTRTRYGGGNDFDTSGSLRFVSIRYGGLVVGLGNELNGLSLGGIGKETTIDHVEIMNNVDDGIEVWGGTVDMKYISIWNVGDDSFDIDHGWRGRAQFGLIVSGYSIPGAASGSGFPDAMIEIDGAAKSDAQPVTTCSLYNFTLVGQPFATGRHAIKFRDGARMQLRNSIIMDCPAEVIRNDNTDNEATDGQTGYGYNGTLTFAQTFTTNWNVYSAVNPFPGGSDATEYPAQFNGKLTDFKGNVFFNNTNTAAYTTANANNVFAAGNGNIQAASTASPIQAITRGPNVISGTLVVQPVIRLDPRPKNGALTAATAPVDNGFWVPVTYRGAFASDSNWLCGWTAADSFGFIIDPPGGCVTQDPADINNDGVVNGEDLGLLLGSWGQAGVTDINADGTTNGSDLGLLLGAWG